MRGGSEPMMATDDSRSSSTALLTLDTSRYVAISPPAARVRRVQEASYLPLIAFTVRTERAPMTLAPSMRDAIWSVDKNQAGSRVLTMEEAPSQSSALRRTGTVVFV